EIRDAVDHVVEAMVRVHPVDRERTAVRAGLARAQRAGEAREALLSLLELGEVGLRHLLRRDRGDQALELGAEQERLPHLLARERADAEAAVRLERDEPERREPAQRLAHGRAADRV